MGLLRKILASQELRSENPELAWQAVNELERGRADFADYVIGLCGKAEKATSTCTFDRRTAGCELFRLLSFLVFAPLGIHRHRSQPHFRN